MLVMMVSSDLFCSYYYRFSVFANAALQVIDTLTKDHKENFRKILKELSPSKLEWARLRDVTSSTVIGIVSHAH